MGKLTASSAFKECSSGKITLWYFKASVVTARFPERDGSAVLLLEELDTAAVVVSSQRDLLGTHAVSQGPAS